MKIEKAYPPNIEAIIKRFPKVKNTPNVVFTWGSTIHNPSDITLPPWIISHEEVHAEQQMKTSPERWWEIYLDDDDYRYHQELEAHQREYQVFVAYAKSRNERRLGLKGMAKRLSGDIYGNCVSYDLAKWEIKNV